MPLFFLAACWAPPGPGQSLGELSRLEAERRRGLQERGVQGRVLGEEDLARSATGANVSTFSPAPSIGTIRSDAPHRSGSPAAYRRKLQKLDRDILLTGRKVRDLRAKLARQRWALPDSGRRTRSGSGAAEEGLRDQIRDLTRRLELLHSDRRQVYDEGRRAGFLPGELDGRGYFP